MFDFYVIDKKNKIIVKNNSVSTNDMPRKIDSFKLDIIGSKLSSNIIDIDLLNYLKFQRVYDEVFIITPETLNISTGNIPNGIYTLVFKINNTIEVRTKLAYLEELTEKINNIALEVDDSIDIDNDAIFTDNLPFDNRTSKIYYIIAVYFKLLVLLYDDTNEDKVNDLIDKLERLTLTI